MSEEKEPKYIYPVEELDKIIEQMDKGIMPMMNDQLQLESHAEMKDCYLILY